MKTYRLVPHQAHPPESVTDVQVDLWVDEEEILLTYRVGGCEALRLPAVTGPLRMDGLWQTTCFELFLRPAGGDAYLEFNFSPSGAWAAYRFDHYRDGMADLKLPTEPHVERGDPGDDYVVEADVDLSAMPAGRLDLGLSAVIEETTGRKSYWALAHPPGDTPDFHHADCFAAVLSPADEA